MIPSDSTVVSVVMPTYNSCVFLEESVASVLGQTFAGWELLIVDDGSTDGTVRLAKSLAESDSRIRVMEQPMNLGAAQARNRAIRESRGRFVAFLDSDDLWHPEKLERQIKFMVDRKVSFSYASYAKIDEFGVKTSESLKIPEKIDYAGLLRTCPIGCLTAVFDTHALGKVMMPDVRRGQDYALWLQLLKRTDHAFGLQECLGYYRVRSGSISSNKFRKAWYQWQIYRNVEKLGIIDSFRYFVSYAGAGFIKYLR